MTLYQQQNNRRNSHELYVLFTAKTKSGLVRLIVTVLNKIWFIEINRYWPWLKQNLTYRDQSLLTTLPLYYIMK